MPLKIEQINKSISKKITIFIGLLIITKRIATGNDVCGPEIVYSQNESKQIEWGETAVSSKQIPSDCLFEEMQLLLRICESGGEWNPTRDITQSYCKYYQPSYEKYGNCPPDYIESEIEDLCYREITYQPREKSENLCLRGGSSLSFLDLNSTEQYRLLQELLPSRMNTLNIGLPAKNQHPSKRISSEIDYTTEEVELQWQLPGKYGSILKFGNNSASVICSYRNLCIDMCLSINTTQSTIDKPVIATIEECSNINSGLCVSRKNSALHNFGCSKGGFRVAFEAGDSLCYSIKVFNQPILANSGGGNKEIIKYACGEKNIFKMNSLESYIIYRQLAFVNKLNKDDRCLFGVSSSNRVIKRSDFNADEIKFTNWDKTMDFDVLNRLYDSYLTVNSDGKWRWEEKATCIVCTMNEAPSAVKLILWYNTCDSMLYLNVTGQQYLWKEESSQLGFLCFALIANDYTEVPYGYAIENNFYSLPNVGTGLYWCSGHVIRSFHFVESKNVYAFGMVFAVYVEYYCEDECGEPLEQAGNFKRLLDLFIDEDLMKIEDVYYIEHDTGDTKKEMKLMFHVTVSTKEEILHDIEKNETGLSADELKSYIVLKQLQNVQSKDSQFNILSVKSRERCLPDSISSLEVLNWKAAKFGDIINITIACYNFSRPCYRIGSKGAEWENDFIIFTCNNQSDTTQSLIDLYNNFSSPEQTIEVITNLTTALQNGTLTAGDMFVVSEIFRHILDFMLSDHIFLKYSELKNIFHIFNSLMLITEEVAIESSQWNTTNSLLASLDKILNYQVQSSIIHLEAFSDGILSIKTPLVAIFVLDPIVSGLSGVGIFENLTTEDENFLSYSTRYLQPNQSDETLLHETNLVVASFVPKKLIEILENPKLIFTIFFNDILFQSTENTAFSDGKIISLTIVNSDSKFLGSIPFYFKPNQSLLNHTNYRSAQYCGYWSLTSIYGWESTGCLMNELSLQFSDTILCECSHLTHFGNLINPEIMYSELHENILNLITLAGCALSLIGILGIFITAIVFRSWRSKSSSKFLLQLSAAIALQISLLIFINSDDDILMTISGNVYGCIAMGALMHYSILVMFFWMLIVAYLQFIRYVIVFSQLTTANFLIKSSIFGWGMPLLPVFLVVAIDPTSYIPSSNVKFCYPSGYGLLGGLLIPIIIIVIANIFVFIAVIVSLIKGSSKSSACKYNNYKNDAMWSQLRLSVFLFFALGLSWIFGFLSNGSILFSFLFCLTATMQGFVLFFYFVILDPVARNLWKKLFLKMCGRKKS